MRRTPLRYCLALLSALLCAFAAPAQADEAIAVIVAPQHGDARFDVSDLALVFRRKRQYWPDGSRIQPVNLAADDPVRIAFSRAVLGADPTALDNYWNEEYFRGIRPPYVVGSSEAMLRFVADTPGAVGYVSACQASSAVAVIAYIDSGGHWHRRSSVPAC